MKKHNKAIVTIAIGDKHTQFFEKFCKPTWVPYAEKYGYDIIVFNEPIRPEYVTEAKTIHWQKCFILEHETIQQYEDVVWVDTDVLINFHRAPCIVSSHQSEKIGVVSLQMPTERISENTSGRFIPYKSYCMNALKNPENKAAFADYFRKLKYNKHIFKKPTSAAINTGVMVMKPALHMDFMRDVFFKYQHIDKTDDWEQGPLSTELIEQDMVDYLDYGFNVIFYYELVHHYPFLWESIIIRNEKFQSALLAYCATTVFINSYFLHFPGEKTQIPFVAVGTADEFVMPNFFNVIYKPDSCVLMQLG